MQQVRLKYNCSLGGDVQVAEDLSERNTKICSDSNTISTYEFGEADIDFKWADCRCHHACRQLSYSHVVLELNLKAREELERDMMDFREEIEAAPGVKRKMEAARPIIKRGLSWSHGDHLHKNYSPKMRFFDFLTSLGGILSLWLGVSVLSFYDALRKVGRLLGGSRPKSMVDRRRYLFRNSPRKLYNEPSLVALPKRPSNRHYRKVSEPYYYRYNTYM